jgi:hypothetical protein
VTDERQRIARELQRHAAHRKKNLAAADDELAQIAKLLPAALRVGITKMDVHRLTGISRPTIDALLDEQRKAT